MTKEEKDAAKLAKEEAKIKAKEDKKAEDEAEKLAKEAKSEAEKKAKELAAADKKDKKENPRFKIGSLGYLGGMAIGSIQEKIVDNRKYNNVELINGVGYLLSDKDLKKQVTKEA